MLGRDIADPLTGFFVIRREAFLHAARRTCATPASSCCSTSCRRTASSGTARCRSISGSGCMANSSSIPLSPGSSPPILASKLTGGVVPASLISFLIVGGSGVFVHLAVLYAALAATGHFAVSQTLAALAAVTSNFLLNNRLTFRDQRLRGTGWSRAT